MTNLEFNPKFVHALDLLENTTKNIFITGKAGTGKSTLLNYFRKTTRKKVAFLAPTGVAALNIKGETIHSFFTFSSNITPEKAKRKAQSRKNTAVYDSITTILIDEISMVRADLLDCIDIFLKTVRLSKKPFGGVQMIFIGDLYQLPPVLTNEEAEIFNNLYETPYFFSSQVCDNASFEFEKIEMEKIYRQSDDRFITLLNHVRTNTLTPDDFQILQKRVNFKPELAPGTIYLTTTNKIADQINLQKLSELPAPIHTSTATIDGDFKPKYAPTEEHLKLKEGAQVMLLTNDPSGAWVNGTIGEIIEIVDPEIIIKTQENRTIVVKKHKWQLYKYAFDETKNQITQEPVGEFTQYPIKCAWALTIHKSQGKTFENVILDIGYGTFAHGQAYVGLSRAKSLEGLILKKPIQKHHIKMDTRIVKYLEGYKEPETQGLLFDSL